jgi:hypothetical protein
VCRSSAAIGNAATTLFLSAMQGMFVVSDQVGLKPKTQNDSMFDLNAGSPRSMTCWWLNFSVTSRG